MSEYDDELKGVLFRNDKKREGKKDPDYKGNATVQGREYWLSAWINEAKSGNKFMSIKFKAKEEKPPEQPQLAATEPDFNDDIPF